MAQALEKIRNKSGYEGELAGNVHAIIQHLAKIHSVGSEFRHSL